MRGVGEPVYSGPTLPPLGPGERAEVEADMVSNPQQLILFWWGGPTEHLKMNNRKS